MRALGHIQDDPDPRDWLGVGRMLGVGIGSANSRFVDRLDYRSFCADVRDQGAVSDCVGEAVCAAIDTQARLVGRMQPYGSPYAAYAIGRALDAPDPDAPLLDFGSKPRMVIQGVAKWGLVALERWNPTGDAVNERPPFDVLKAGGSARIQSYARIEGEDVVSQLATALGSGFVPIFAMKVDAAYMSLEDGTIYQGLTGPSKGSHMQAIVGHDLAAAEPYFWVRNSWSAGWGAGGYSRIAASFIASEDATDRYVLRSTPWPA